MWRDKLPFSHSPSFETTVVKPIQPSELFDSVIFRGNSDGAFFKRARLPLVNEAALKSPETDIDLMDAAFEEWQSFIDRVVKKQTVYGLKLEQQPKVLFMSRFRKGWFPSLHLLFEFKRGLPELQLSQTVSYLMGSLIACAELEDVDAPATAHAITTDGQRLYKLTAQLNSLDFNARDNAVFVHRLPDLMNEEMGKYSWNREGVEAFRDVLQSVSSV